MCHIYSSWSSSWYLWLKVKVLNPFISAVPHVKDSRIQSVSRGSERYISKWENKTKRFSLEFSWTSDPSKLIFLMESHPVCCKWHIQILILGYWFTAMLLKVMLLYEKGYNDASSYKLHQNCLDFLWQKIKLKHGLSSKFSGDTLHRSIWKLVL